MKDTGKSYLLNHFLSALKAFKVGPKKPSKNTMNVISIFSEPIEITRDGMTFDIYFIDSVGFEPTDTEEGQENILAGANLNL